MLCVTCGEPMDVLQQKCESCGGRESMPCERCMNADEKEVADGG
jgi:hypothetical protein